MDFTLPLPDAPTYSYPENEHLVSAVGVSMHNRGDNRDENIGHTVGEPTGVREDSTSVGKDKLFSRRAGVKYLLPFECRTRGDGDSGISLVSKCDSVQDDYCPPSTSHINTIPYRLP